MSTSESQLLVLRLFSSLTNSIGAPPLRLLSMLILSEAHKSFTLGVVCLSPVLAKALLVLKRCSHASISPKKIDQPGMLEGDFRQT